MTDLFNNEDVLTLLTADQAVISTKGYFGDNLHDLINNEDVLTLLTADQAVISTKGYFGDNLHDLINAIKHSSIKTLLEVDDTTFCFKCDDDLYYAFFLPIDKVKNKEPTYRPLKNIDELFNFLIPDIDVDCDTFEKVKCILCRIYELKGKQTGYIYYKTFTRILLSDDNIRLDECTLEHFFENYEIKKDGEFVPFGILEE